MQRYFVFFLSLIGAVTVTAQDRVVRDLEYGHALFHFYQEDYFESAARLLAAEQQRRIEHHGDDAQLLLGGIYLSYGQQLEANDIFVRLLDDNVKPAVRDRAWLYAAQIAYQRGRSDNAQTALARIGSELEPEFEARKRLLQAQILIEQGQHEQAVAVLDDWRAPAGWRAYAQYNHAVALIRAGEMARGTQLLARAGEGGHADSAQRSWLRPWTWLGSRRASVDYREGEALRDKINLALGFAHLKSGAPAQAQPVLASIGDDGPWASKARLGAGWAAVETEQYRDALTHWEKLNGGNPLDPAVQESRLGVPFAYAKLGDEDAALAGYRDAIAVFAGEIERLQSLSAKLVDDQFLGGLLGDDDGHKVGWFWSLDNVPNDDRGRYLYALMADHQFQEGLKNYRDLTALRANLLRWQEGAEAFDIMLRTRTARYAQRTSQLAVDDRETRLAQLSERFDSYARRLVQAGREDDTLAFATPAEHNAFIRLARVERTLARVGDEPKYQLARDKHRLLKGTLLWRLNDEYAARLWEQRKQMKGLSAQLLTARARNAKIATAFEQQPVRFSNFAQRIATVRPRIDALQARVDGSMRAHEAYLKAIALEQFALHTQRLQAYLTEAQFALASTYDRLSLAVVDP